MARHVTPPEEITLVYRPVGPSHVFTANGPGMSGFHISHPDRKIAFTLAGEALGKHVQLMYGVDAQYEFERSFDDFEAHLKSEISGNQVKARITHRAAAYAGAAGKLRGRHEGQAADIQGADPMRKPRKPPKALDAIVDKVLAYRPKPTSKPAKKRQRTRNRLAKERL